MFEFMSWNDGDAITIDPRRMSITIGNVDIK
jgi:hypothetical protein